MSNYIVSDTSLGSVADAIRTKGGTSAPLTYPQGFIDAIDAISGGDDTPIPDDGKTRIWIHIAEGTPDNRLTFYLRFTASATNNTTVDWGDGVSETLGSTTATNYPHTYSQGGDYVITLTVNSGTISFEGNSVNGGNSIYGTRANANYYNRIRIKQIVFGDDVAAVGDYACYECFYLTSVTILNGATSIGLSAFNNCYSLASLMIPNGIASVGAYALCNCYSLASIIIPDGATSIGASTLSRCYGLTSVTISSTVTSIASQTFYNCYCISEFHFKPTTPPALANSNAFFNIASDCIIYVPQGSLSAYQSATNYGTVASKMQEEPT